MKKKTDCKSGPPFCFGECNCSGRRIFLSAVLNCYLEIMNFLMQLLGNRMCGCRQGFLSESRGLPLQQG